MEEHTNGHIPAVTQPADYPGYKPPEHVSLPSGAVFLLRKPQIRKMIQRGEIPNPLMNIIQGIFVDRDQLELAAEAEKKGLTEEELLEQRAADAEADIQDPTKPPPVPIAQRVEEEMTVEAVMGFRDVIIWATIVEPRVEIAPRVDGPLTASGALSYDAIDEDDLQYILKYANGDLDAMATFPAESERQDPGTDGGEVRDEAELVAGHPA